MYKKVHIFGLKIKGCYLKTKTQFERKQRDENITKIFKI